MKSLLTIGALVVLTIVIAVLDVYDDFRHHKNLDK
jgi:hypothetical protein